MNEWSSGKGVGVMCEIEFVQFSLKTVGNCFAKNSVKNWLK